MNTKELSRRILEVMDQGDLWSGGNFQVEFGIDNVDCQQALGKLMRKGLVEKFEVHRPVPGKGPKFYYRKVGN